MGCFVLHKGAAVNSHNILSDRENDIEVKHCKVTLRKIGQRHTQLSVKMKPPVQLWSEKGLSTVFTSTHSNHVWKIVRKAVASSFSAAKIRYLLKINKKELYIPQLLAVQRVVKFRNVLQSLYDHKGTVMHVPQGLLVFAKGVHQAHQCRLESAPDTLWIIHPSRCTCAEMRFDFL